MSGMPSYGLSEDYPRLWEIAQQHDFAERLGGSRDPVAAEVDAALRELWNARRPLSGKEVPMNRLDYWCQMCGAVPGKPCTVISGDPEAGENLGDERLEPHFYRSSPHSPAVLIPDEPPFKDSPA